MSKCKIENDHPRMNYRKTIVSLWKISRGSSLRYERTSDSFWPDLVLRDKSGKEVARVCTFGTFGNNDLRYAR